MRAARTALCVVLSILSSSPAVACTFFPDPAIPSFQRLTPLPRPRAGILLRTWKQGAESAADVGSWLRIETSNDVGPVATIRRFHESANAAHPRYSEVTVARCPALVESLRELRAVPFHVDVAVPGEPEWKLVDSPEDACASMHFELWVSSDPAMQWRFDTNDTAQAAWARKTVAALLACPGFEERVEPRP